MRTTHRAHGLTVHAVAGTHTVLLGMDLADPAGCLGFAIHRTDHTEDECAWLRGMKTFPSIVPDPPSGSDYSTREHPIQGFQWGDYTAKPGHAYTYAVSSLGGSPAAPTVLGTSSVTVHTEVEDDGVHGIWFNRGVAGSQAFARKFAGWVPGDVPDETHPAMVWLSRGLGEAFVAFCGEALDGDWALRGAFYELTWGTGLDALAAARARGVDVRLVVHGRDRDTDPAKDADRTAEEAHAAAQAHGLSDVVTWRTAPNKSALFHHKFLVLLHRGQPVAVWTGSTNLTVGAVYGHSNVGHLLRHRVEAEAFHAEWERVAAEQPTAALRTTHQSEPPVSETVPAPPDVTVVMSPRTGLSALQWYAALFDGAATSAHITGAFGLNTVFRDALAEARHTVMRTVLLEKVPPANQRIPLTDPNVRLATGSYLATSPLEQWAAERLTGFNVHVRFIHTKIILVDPLGEDPTILTGSANYSDASTTNNEENTLVIRHGPSRAASGRAVRRVADIYLTEYHRLFMHYAFRAMAQRIEVNTGASNWTGHLDETDAWTRRYYAPGSWRELQRHLFAGEPAAP
jgi:phosphatidylserine/phosphatidylglycerophosphate/cardiolipin synthase-like enzyme